MDKRESREKLINIFLVLAGLGLVTCIIIYSRGGLGWFTETDWSRVSIFNWIAIVCILGVAVVMQYYFLMLLRYSIARFLVLWLLPIIWLFNNGLVAIQRLLESAAEQALSGWIPITDLMGWLLGVVFFPLLIGGGAVAAVADSSSILLASVCSIAGFALDVSGDMLSHILDFLGGFWDLVVNSFTQAMFPDDFKTRPFFDLGLDGVFKLPHWFYSAGYSFTCIIS